MQNGIFVGHPGALNEIGRVIGAGDDDGHPLGFDYGPEFVRRLEQVFAGAEILPVLGQGLCIGAIQLENPLASRGIELDRSQVAGGTSKRVGDYRVIVGICCRDRSEGGLFLVLYYMEIGLTLERQLVIGSGNLDCCGGIIASCYHDADPLGRCSAIAVVDSNRKPFFSGFVFRKMQCHLVRQRVMPGDQARAITGRRVRNHGRYSAAQAVIGVGFDRQCVHIRQIDFGEVYGSVRAQHGIGRPRLAGIIEYREAEAIRSRRIHSLCSHQHATG